MRNNYTINKTLNKISQMQLDNKAKTKHYSTFTQ